MVSSTQTSKRFVSLAFACAILGGCGPGVDNAELHPPVDDVVLCAALQTQHSEARQLQLPLPRDGQPVVLVHGMAGFRPISTLLDYFYRVRKHMLAQGFQVYALQTDAFQSVAYRGKQLAIQIDEVLALTGASRVHVIAHSQGGLDIRYAISTLGYGDRISTVVTIASPHQGVQIVDMALQLIPAWVERVANIVDKVANALLGGNNDVMAQLHDLTHTYVTETFNPQNPDDPRVAYYSYAGLTQANPFVNQRLTDIVNPLLVGTLQLISKVEGDNDGLVPVSSAQWGTYLGAVAADHWDEIGQPPAMFHPSFDHLSFYDALAQFLGRGGTPPLFN
jgi:triacylglycerol lipase